MWISVCYFIDRLAEEVETMVAGDDGGTGAQVMLIVKLEEVAGRYHRRGRGFGPQHVVSGLAVDHTGSRVLSGSYDYTVRMYDFQGMNSKLQSFRQLEPFEGHQVRSLSWSPTSDRFLCVTGLAQAKIYDRDGLTLREFFKGDMYIRDLKNTKGHISELTGGEWNLKSKETILVAPYVSGMCLTLKVRSRARRDFVVEEEVVPPPEDPPITSDLYFDICGTEPWPETPATQGEEPMEFCYFCTKVVPKKEDET